jgi:hypothetical protein
MPAALPADWNGLRLMYAHGSTLEEIAETSGISLNTLKARSAREGWNRRVTEAREEKQAKQLSVAVENGQMQPHATNALETVDILLRDRQKQTKLSQSKYLVRASDKLSNVDDERLLDHAPVGKLLSDMASKVWPEQQVAGSAVATRKWGAVYTYTLLCILHPKLVSSGYGSSPSLPHLQNRILAVITQLQHCSAPHLRRFLNTRFIWPFNRSF